MSKKIKNITLNTQDNNTHETMYDSNQVPQRSSASNNYEQHFDSDDEDDRVEFPQEVAIKIVSGAVLGSDFEQSVPDLIKTTAMNYISELLKISRENAENSTVPLTTEDIYATLTQLAKEGEKFPYNNDHFSASKFKKSRNT